MSDAAKPATMPDVARRAGVSVSTVSRTLRGLPSVSPATRERVEEAARELSFTISRSASSLVTGRTGRVAVMVWDTRPWFVGAVLSGVSSVLRTADLDLLVYTVPTMEERRAFFEQLPASRNADALLVVSFDLTDEERGRLDELGMPLIFVSQCIPERASVHIDDVAGARQGTRHLVNLGHRNIAFVQPQDDRGFSWSARRRVEGYREVLAEAGIPVNEELVLRGEAGIQAGMRAASQILSAPRPPTGVFAENDEIAMGLLRVLRNARIDVPGSISVLGFDDHEMAEPFDLSTVAQPAAELGRAAAELACAVIGGEQDSARHIVLPTSLLPRGTTAPVRAGGPGDAAFATPAGNSGNNGGGGGNGGNGERSAP